MMWLGITAFAIYLTPNVAGHGTHQSLGLPPCPSVLLFDRPCPGCGLTTSWTALVHGQFNLAFRSHALGPILYILFTIGALTGMVAWIRGLRVNMESKWLSRAMTGVIAVFILFGFARMALTPGFAMPSERWLSRLNSNAN
jgi:hypothetical protein